MTKFASYPRLNPRGIGKNVSAAHLIGQTFLACNGGRLREAACECDVPVFTSTVTKIITSRKGAKRSAGSAARHA